MAEQLGFELPGIAALERADFLVAPSNAVAVSMIESWQSWSNNKLLLVGPEGSGKTHLAHVWAQMSGAQICKANTLNEENIPSLAQSNLAVEDIEQISDIPEAQHALFHLHNLALAEGHSLLMTGRGVPKLWKLGLPDLQSRIEGTQSVTIAPPDDALLSAVLAKLLADRQVTPKPDLIPYLVTRMDRSFGTARRLVAELDTASLAQKRPVTRSLAAQVLGTEDKNP